jgi:hypothetical protein
MSLFGGLMNVCGSNPTSSDTWLADTLFISTFLLFRGGIRGMESLGF